MWKEIERNDYTIQLSNPEIYVNNKKRNRSGHMSHAMAEFAPDTVIDFNSNCSPVRCNGHSQYGWIEYRISKDGGETFGEAQELPYAKEAFLDGIFTVSVEKAVACDDGSIVAFCLRNDTLYTVCCEPWFEPKAVKSTDGGKTWGEPVAVSSYCGRMYDALYQDGVIYVLQLCNKGDISPWGNKPEHLYRIFASYNNGKSFEELCVVPFASTFGRGYGTMVFDEKKNLHVYIYNENSEREMDHIISPDLGKTWNNPSVCYVEKGIRNPQIAIIDDVYILHGRGEKGKGFVLYSSSDGQNWDKGEYLETDKVCCYYSNNIVLNDPKKGKRMLIQYSDTYDSFKVNVMHMWLKIIK